MEAKMPITFCSIDGYKAYTDPAKLLSKTVVVTGKTGVQNTTVNMPSILGIIEVNGDTIYNVQSVKVQNNWPGDHVFKTRKGKYTLDGLFQRFRWIHPVTLETYPIGDPV